MIKGIIFDFDNTLYNYEKINNDALDFIIKDISIIFSIDEDIIRNAYNNINYKVKNSNNPCNKFNKTIYFKLLFEKINIHLKYLSEYVTMYNDKFSELFNLYDGVLDLFCFLKSKNLKIGILSNNVFFQQYVKLKESNLIEYIDVIQTSDECGEEKPNKYMFLSIQNKMQIPFENLAYIGDNYNHDIIPAIEFGMIPFWFHENYNLYLTNKTIYFGCFNKLLLFFKDYFKTINELIFLSKYFGQSILNVQGPGGNISIKQNDFLFIKSSGYILGNISQTEGYCIVDYKECYQMIETKKNNIKDAKIFGSKVPSMETYFHSFMKKYTVHLHFTPSNIFFCSKFNNINLLQDFIHNYKIIDFYSPGLELAIEIYKCYTKCTDIYFLKNHGIIITSDTIDKIIEYYEYIFDYFNKKLNNIYDYEKNSFLLNQVFFKNHHNVVVRNIEIPIKIFKDILICFPDMAVFLKNILEINSIENFSDNFINCDVILYNGYVYCISENIKNLYSLMEILDSYKIIYFNNNGEVSLITNVTQIQNMPEEKYRISL